MIIDADTHYSLPQVFDDLPFKHTHWEEYKVNHDAYIEVELESNWQELYNTLAGSDWPSCKSYKDFKTLPEFVRQEIVDHYTPTVFNITTEELTVDVKKISIKTSSQLPGVPSVMGLPTLNELMGIYKSELQVDAALLNPQTGQQYLNYYSNVAESVELMRAYNRNMLTACAEHKEFDVTAWLALQDINASLREIEWIADNEFFAVYLNFYRTQPFHSEFDLVFKKCAELKMPVYIHPTLERVPVNRTIEITPLYQLLKSHWSHPVDEWKVSVATMIANHTVDKFPDLKIVIAEEGIAWVKDMQDFMVNNGLPDPLPYFKKNFWFTTEVEDETFISDATYLGWDRLMFATDYPHYDVGGMHATKDVGLLDHYLSTGKISNSDYELVTHKNYINIKQR